MLYICDDGPLALIPVSIPAPLYLGDWVSLLGPRTGEWGHHGGIWSERRTSYIYSVQDNARLKFEHVTHTRS